jgi:hypothetical protein
MQAKPGNPGNDKHFTKPQKALLQTLYQIMAVASWSSKHMPIEPIFDKKPNIL